MTPDASVHALAAIVGMPGSGKSEAARAFRAAGYAVVRFGDVTEDELRAQGLAQTPETEQRIREELRAREGMAAYAIRSIPRIDHALEDGPVVADGLYSWEEYIQLKDTYGDRLVVLAVVASPRLRYTRLATRTVRPLTPPQARERDRAEIEALNKGGPIAMADVTLLNEGPVEDFQRAVSALAEQLKSG
jgi:dephospho-CoA kinase